LSSMMTVLNVSTLERGTLNEKNRTDQKMTDVRFYL